MGLAMRNFYIILQAAEPGIQTALREAWQEAGLDRIMTLEQLEQAFHDKD